MRILVTGAAGLLGSAVVRTAGERGHDVRAFPRSALDVTDPGQVDRRLRAEKPEVVIHCAAYTAVDRAEEESDQAMSVNRDGTRNVAMAAAEIGATVVYPSTDFVFNGRAGTPYRPDDETSPVSAYGVSKLAGEQVLAVSGCSWIMVRTSWLYGPGGWDFVDVVLEQAERSGGMSVVDDQVGCPTWTGSLAPGIVDLVEAGATGTYHLCDAGQASWLALAQAVVEEAGLDLELTATSTLAWGAPAQRPPYSVLDCEKAEGILGRDMTPWRESLHTYLSETL
ncbi:MAG: dTDP-4-dehydrorhamnose reductase [Gemmatimonadetes bacterium]|nr:dTDP-4-dehydrorhamnose reductase [Gemmatimonadota bacterium]